MLNICFAFAILATSVADDFSTLDRTVKVLYETVSGPAGPRDWDRFKSLFAPNSMLRAIVRQPDGNRRIVEMSVDTYVTRNSPAFERDAFYESEIHRKTDVFGDIAQVWSTYEIRNKNESAPIMRGVNSISLRFDGQRWWIVSVLWQPESADNPIPKEYLPNQSSG